MVTLTINVGGGCSLYLFGQLLLPPCDWATVIEKAEI